MPPSTFSRDTVIAAAKAAFPDHTEAALAELGRYGAAPGENEPERVQLAIIALSGGSLDALRNHVAMAKVDYRDVLAAQQLGPLPEAEGGALQDAARDIIGKWGKP